MPNGLGSTAVGDNNGAKSVTLSVTSQLTSGLRVGMSAYADQLSAGTLNPSGTPLDRDLGFGVFNGFLHFMDGRAEATAEIFRTRSAPEREAARPYKAALPPKRAIEIIRAEADRGWRDRRISEVFATMVLEEEAGVGLVARSA